MRVELVSLQPNANNRMKPGMTGTFILEEFDEFGIQFDEFIDGHDLGGRRGRDGYCYWVRPEQVRSVDIEQDDFTDAVSGFSDFLSCGGVTA